MAKTTPEKAALVSVVLTCIYSGFKGDPGPGDTVAVPPEEAARLVDIGAAKKAD
jgi:hypothetical protein